jgi:hypothetical protein
VLRWQCSCSAARAVEPPAVNHASSVSSSTDCSSSGMASSGPKTACATSVAVSSEAAASMSMGELP